MLKHGSVQNRFCIKKQLGQGSFSKKLRVGSRGPPMFRSNSSR